MKICPYMKETTTITKNDKVGDVVISETVSTEEFKDCPLYSKSESNCGKALREIGVI